MKLLKKWRKHPEADEHAAPLAKRQHDRGGGDLFTRLRDEMDHAFDRVWKDFGENRWTTLGNFDVPALNALPAFDMTEDDKVVTYRLDVPGLDERDLDVEVSGSLLTVRGRREESGNGRGRREHASASFVETVTLPTYVDPAGLDARYAKGVLTITVPRVAGKGPKRVRVSG